MRFGINITSLLGLFLCCFANDALTQYVAGPVIGGEMHFQDNHPFVGVTKTKEVSVNTWDTDLDTQGRPWMDIVYNNWLNPGAITEWEVSAGSIEPYDWPYGGGATITAPADEQTVGVTCRADDLAMFANDPPVIIGDLLYVVLPNEESTSWYAHVDDGWGHYGDAFFHWARHRASPPPWSGTWVDVDFSGIQITEADGWEFVSKNHMFLSEAQIMTWMATSMPRWTGTWTILPDNQRDQMGDKHGINRNQLYGGWRYGGFLEIKQKMKVLYPSLSGYRWDLNVSFKLVNAANGQYLTYAKKQGYTYTGPKMWDGGAMHDDPSW